MQEYAKQKGFGNKVKVIINTEKCYCLKNYYREIHKVPDDRIIVTLDGDDALAGADVLLILMECTQTQMFGALMVTIKSIQDHSGIIQNG